MIANWVLGVPDAHAKNYSIILGPTGVEALTPLYDVATGLGYPDSNEVAMGFDREKRMYKITGQHLLDFARANALDGEFLLQLARTMAALMPAAFATAAEATMAAAQLTGGDMSRLRSTTELLIEHCRKVGVLISQVE